MKLNRVTTVEQFWARMDRSGGPDACWPWLGAETHRGHGSIMIDRAHVNANRVAWSIANGRPVPDGATVLQRCGNPRCCNPSHLLVGTASDLVTARETEDRFWSKVDQSGGPDACWPWLGGVRSDGYGRFCVGRKTFGAHRVAWQFRNGEIPDGMLVCHECDTPICTNPAHMFLGWPADNSADMVTKKRSAIGQRVGTSKLTPDDIRRIRLLAGTMRQTDIGRLFGVAQPTIGAILKRATWSHVQ